jgi:hypothetical protein
MSSFEQIIGETKLDGEIEATDFIAEQIVNRLREHNYGHADIMYYAIQGYLQELRELKNDQ